MKFEVETLADIEDHLMECHELWWRTPGGGRSPFAKDAPWYLIVPEPGDYGGDGIDGASSSRRPRPALDAGEVGRRDALSAWLQLIEDPVDRNVVRLASCPPHLEAGKLTWKRIKALVGWDKGESALAWRYKRGLATILCRINGWPSRRITALASAGIERKRSEDDAAAA